MYKRFLKTLLVTIVVAVAIPVSSAVARPVPDDPVSSPSSTVTGQVSAGHPRRTARPSVVRVRHLKHVRVAR